MSEANLNSGMEVQGKELRAFLDNPEDAQILGRAMSYDVGDVLVPRDWLLGELRTRGVPERMFPTEPTPHSAYKRAMARLVTSNPQNGRKRSDRRFVQFDSIGHHKPLRVELDLADGDGNINHLRAHVFFPAVLTGNEGGRWVDHDLGWFNYRTESQTVSATKADDCPEALEDLWDEMKERAMFLHQDMQEHHTGDDLRHMVYLNMILNPAPDWPRVVPLRSGGGFYFVPEGPLSNVLEVLSEVFSLVNDQFKTGGNEMSLRTMKVMDDEAERQWVQSAVETSLEKVVDDVIEDAFEALDEGEETVEQIVQTVQERMEDAEDEADQFNQLLQAKLDVESILASRAAEVDDDEKQEIIEQAVGEVEG